MAIRGGTGVVPLLLSTRQRQSDNQTFSIVTEHRPILRRVEEVWRFRQTPDAESDRGCALMAAAYLDSQLEELIRMSLVADNKAVDELLGVSKPLGTFSSRIDLAYLLGHFSKNAHRDLELIRKIRNEFGHTPTPLDFTHPPIQARCKELYHSFLKDDAPRKRFTNTVLGLLAWIHGAMYKSKRPKLHVDIDAEYTQFKAAILKAFETNPTETLVSYLEKLSELDDELDR